MDAHFFIDRRLETSGVLPFAIQVESKMVLRELNHFSNPPLKKVASSISARQRVFLFACSMHDLASANVLLAKSSAATRKASIAFGENPCCIHFSPIERIKL